jgi:hypothetical protein
MKRGFTVSIATKIGHACVHRILRKGSHTLVTDVAELRLPEEWLLIVIAVEATEFEFIFALWVARSLCQILIVVGRYWRRTRRRTASLIASEFRRSNRLEVGHDGLGIPVGFATVTLI